MKQCIAVVVTYNRLNLLKECIECLQQQTIHCDILIIDNNSTDGTGEYIIKKMGEVSGIYYKKTNENMGGAGGFNLGIHLAVQMGYEFIWIMDDDCMPQKEALQEFFNFNDTHKRHYGYLSSKVLWKNGNLCTMNIQRKTMYKKVVDFQSSSVRITMASFVSLFIPTYIVQEVGLPIKDFFIWTDDWEYTRRISLKYNCYLINKSVVIHKSSSNTGANIAFSEISRLNRFFYLYRNDVYLYRREGLSGFFYECIRLLSHIIRVLLFSRDSRMKRISLILKGTFVGLGFYPRIEKIEKPN